MPLGSDLPENEPASTPDPVNALKLKINHFRKHLLLAHKYSHPHFPMLVWNKNDLNELRALVHDVYLQSHKLSGTTQGKELRWVDGKYKSLRLIKTVVEMIKTIPLRPIGLIERELLKINPAYNPTLLLLRLDKTAFEQHNSLQEANPRYKALIRLSAAIGEPKTSITQVQVSEFETLLGELCANIKPHIELGWEKFKEKRVQKLISQVLFLDLQRQEVVWRLAYWDQVEALAGWIVGLHDQTLTDMLSEVAVYVPETPSEFLDRRNRKTTLARVKRHRIKQKSTKTAE
jgi:hypothetical protein